MFEGVEQLFDGVDDLRFFEEELERRSFFDVLDVCHCQSVRESVDVDVGELLVEVQQFFLVLEVSVLFLQHSVQQVFVDQRVLHFYQVLQFLRQQEVRSCPACTARSLSCRPR